jgi:hypothetical protein
MLASFQVDGGNEHPTFHYHPAWEAMAGTNIGVKSRNASTTTSGSLEESS